MKQMKRNFSDPFSKRSSALLLGSVASLLFTASLITGCSQATYPNRGTIVVDSTLINATLFWPSEPKYLAASDTTVLELQGLMRGYTCGQVLVCEVKTDSSNNDSTVLHPYAKIEYPGEPTCPLEPLGLDTSLRYVVPAVPGSLLYLNNSNGLRTDTALIVTAKVWAETLLSIPADNDTLNVGSFTFYDSNATHSSRELYAALPACEVLQGAVFTQSGDSVTVRLHVLQLDSLPSQQTLPPCAGPQTDSVPVVLDRFVYPAN